MRVEEGFIVRPAAVVVVVVNICPVILPDAAPDGGPRKLLLVLHILGEGCEEGLRLVRGDGRGRGYRQPALVDIRGYGGHGGHGGLLAQGLPGAALLARPVSERRVPGLAAAVPHGAAPGVEGVQRRGRGRGRGRGHADDGLGRGDRLQLAGPRTRAAEGVTVSLLAAAHGAAAARDLLVRELQEHLHQTCKRCLTTTFRMECTIHREETSPQNPH